MQPTRAHRGFTLIELLVVMAVISILALLVMPAVISSMKSARATNCKSNLRQISAAFILYAKRHGGLMCPSGAPPKYPRWDRNLEPFALNPEVYRCPSKKRADVGYGLNHMWCGPDQIYGAGTAMNNRSKPITDVVNPSCTIIFCDMGVVRNIDDPADDWMEKDGPNKGLCVRFPYDNPPGGRGKYTYWITSPRRPVPRHLASKTNCLFFDGHVDGVATTDIVDDLWDDPGCLYDNDGRPKRK